MTKMDITTKEEAFQHIEHANKKIEDLTNTDECAPVVVEAVYDVRVFIEKGEHDMSEEEVRELREKIGELQSLVFKDELTGALNRRGFYEKYESFFKDALYAKNNTDSFREPIIEGFAVIFIDVDNFKSINDTYGHDEGDSVLKGIADVLAGEIRETDAVARFGGEEFVAVLLNVDESVAAEKAEEIRGALAQNVSLPKDTDWKVTASIGVAALSDSDADALDELIGYADQAMYEAKTRRGKNVVVRHSELV